MALVEGLGDLEGLARGKGRAPLEGGEIVKLGSDLFPTADAIPSPTVTAARIPDGFTWDSWDRRLRESGLVVAGSYGPLAEKVFRMGHMGTQADMTLMEKALDVIAAAF